MPNAQCEMPKQGPDSACRVPHSASRIRGTSPRLSLRRNFVWALAGNVSYAVGQWGVLVCLAKLGSPEIVGQFGLGLAITGPVIVLSQLQLRAVLATDSNQTFRFGDYLALRLILTAAALAVIAGLALLGGHSRQTVVVVLAIGLGKASESIADVFYAWFQQHERMDHIARALMLHGGLALASAGLAMALTGSSVWAAGGWAAAAAVSLGLYSIPSARRLARESMRAGEKPEACGLRPCWRWQQLVRLTWLSLPLGLVMMLVSLQTNLPRYYLEAYRGDSELGIYTALAYLTVAGNVVMQALGQSASPRLAQQHTTGDGRAFQKLLLQLLGIGLVGGVGGLLIAVLAGEPLLRLLYTEQYAGHAGLLVLLMASAAIGYLASFLGYAMTAARIFRAQVPLFILVTLATAAACWFGVPRYGMEGAAWALIIAAAVQLLGSGLLVVLPQFGQRRTQIP